MRFLALGVLLVYATAHAQLTSRLPIERTLTSLTSADARTRARAAEALAWSGTHDHIVVPLRTALEHEAVPETLSAMITTLARRGDESDVPALDAAWDRASAADRRTIASALDAIGGLTVLPILRRHLASEGLSGRVCAALTRTTDRVAWLASTLDDTASRDRVVSCLASAPASDTRDEALVRAGLDLEPMSAREVLAALARSPGSSEASITLATTALERGDATLQAAALALLSRHAPHRLPIERWRSWLDGNDDREASAVRALLTLVPPSADEALARMRARDGTSARRALTVLLDRDDVADLPRVALFVDTPSTRAAALDRLASSDGGAALLASLPAAPDVDVALAIARPSGDARASLLGRTRRVVLRALVHDVDARACVEARGADGAMCLAILGDSASAASWLATERNPAVVGWLGLAAGDTAIAADAIEALLDDERTRLTALSLAPASLAVATPPTRRALEARIVEATADPDEACRAEAVRALGLLGRSVHRAAVLRALEDTSPQVRLAAAAALASVGAAASDLRVVGRTHVETDARVLAMLRGEALPRAAAPLHLRIVEHDPATLEQARVTLFLADGRSLRLAAYDDEVIVPNVPDAPAIVHLESVPLASRH